MVDSARPEARLMARGVRRRFATRPRRINAKSALIRDRLPRRHVSRWARFASSRRTVMPLMVRADNL
jgi:hypothetical protein